MHLSLPRRFPLFQLLLFCWSLQCLISTLTQGAVVDTFLGSLVQSCCGEGGTLQTNNTGVCSQCLSHTGPAPAHGACSLPAHTARALGCSTGNNPRPALDCMHLPGPSRSGSGTRVVLRGADSRLGLRFVPFPDPSSSDDEVFGARDCCDLSSLCHSVIWRTFSGRC